MPLPETIHFSTPLRTILLADDEPCSVNRENHNAAVREAYQRGVDEATRRFEQQILAQREEMLRLSQATFRSLENQHQSLVGQFRQVIPELVMDTVRRVFAGLEIDREMLGRLVEETLREVTPGRQALEVALSPRDLELIREIEGDFREKYPSIKFRADSELRPGDCVAHTRFGMIDGRIATKLKTVEGFLR
jgi:flagellar biosynthesis/type III secretory pathway protein FliH